MGVRRNPELTLSDRILAGIEIDEGTHCWMWQGSTRGKGYGQIYPEPCKGAYVHVVAYETFIGPIPEGLQIDHLCGVRKCCNPQHLEAVTGRINKLRALTSITTKNAAATHCPAGHEYDEKNTYIRKDNGGRQCRKCNNKQSYASRKRRLKEKRDNRGD